MNVQTTIFGAIAYTAAAVSLELILRETTLVEQHLSVDYFQKQGDYFPWISITVLQGLILSFFYPFVKFRGRYLKRALKFSLTTGLLLWTVQVFAPWIQQSTLHFNAFPLMETIHLAVQFGIYGILIGSIYKKSSPGSR